MIAFTEKSKFDFRLVAVCCILFFGTFLVFQRTLQNGFLDLDDPDYVTQNVHVKAGVTLNGIRWAFTSGDSANWHPLTWISLMLDAQLYGNFARGFHFTNNFLQAFNAVAAFLALWKLTKSFWPSVICAALFAWHPLRVESVAWIAERKDVLSGFFFWLTLLAYANYTQKPRPGIFYGAAFFLFACGLMSKPMLVTVPFLLLLLDYWPARRLDGLTVQRLLIEKIPFLLLSLASCVVTFAVQKNWGAVVESQTLDARLSNAVVSIARYALNIFRPYDLAIVYPLPNRWPLTVITMAAVFVIGVTVIAALQIRRRPWIFVGWFWFVGMLIPVIGIVQVGLQAMADRYSYLPVTGLQLALIWTLREIKTPSIQILKPVAVATILMACILQTQVQINYWRSPELLYEHALAVTKNNYLAECYLGTSLMNENKFSEAEAHFRRAIRVKPDFQDARFKLGVALAKDGRDTDAISEYRALLKLNPGHALAEYNLGISLLDQNQPAQAISHFQNALDKKPNYGPALVAMGTANAKLGNARPAINYFQRALALDPNNAIAEYNFANALIDLHRENDALAHYQKAISLDADFEEAHYNYANALGTLGHPSAARDQFRRALMLNPADAPACFGLAVAFEDLREIAPAVSCYERTIALDPKNAPAHFNLATIFLNQNRCADALEHFQAATRIQPDNDSAFLGAGLAEEKLGRIGKAIPDYRHAVAIAPGNAQAHCCLGIALRRAGKISDAIAEDETALRLNPNFPGLREQLALARREQAAQ